MYVVVRWCGMVWWSGVGHPARHIHVSPSCPSPTSSLARLPQRLHPAIILAIPAHDPRTLWRHQRRRRPVQHRRPQHRLYVGHRPCPEQGHLALQQQRHARAHQQRVALEHVDVPHARGLVEGEVLREEACEDRLEVGIRVAVGGEFGQVLVQGGRFLGERVQDEVVG